MSLSPEARDALTRLRAELASARANLCPCGVKPERCADHRPDRTEESR